MQTQGPRKGIHRLEIAKERDFADCAVVHIDDLAVCDEQIIADLAVIDSKTSNLKLLVHGPNDWSGSSLRSLERVEWLVFGGKENLAVGEDSTSLAFDWDSECLNLCKV
jgi:hypothetical protein